MSLMLSVSAIPAFTDNYIWCVHSAQQALLVDPGEAAPALAFLQKQQLHLTDILITHHHADHIGGLKALITAYPDVTIHGLQSQHVPLVNHYVSPDNACTIKALELDFEVMLLPGHTVDHIAFYHPQVGLFCGDTLFSGGCGRLFEGTPAQMFASLNQLATLPDDTKVYCTHEYTQANLRFALAAEPDNQALKDYSVWVDAQRLSNKPTLPSSIGLERAINPFLRCDSEQVRSQVEQYQGIKANSPEDVFAGLRGWKDHF
ncbi:hydroxyacylglutathione hydrolase [Bowmanella yangjiangensis]|nr:hydroxyacylglutathione hydrolase [Bowmanella yangjiangensis]